MDQRCHYRFLACILILAAVLLTLRCDNTALWIDEAMNSLLGQNVLKFGYPIAWDGSYLVEPYFNVELSPGLVRISHTWLQYYEAALGLALFGHSAIATRLPSVFCGILCVLAVYFLARRMFASPSLACCAALLLVCHTGFLLYSRIARYFSLVFLLSTLFFIAYLRWQRESRMRDLVLFTGCSALLFHAHYIVWPFLLAAAAAHLVVVEGLRWSARLKEFIISSAIVTALALPWILYAAPQQHYIYDWSGSGYWTRLGVLFWKTNTWVMPFPALLGIWGLAYWCSGRRRSDLPLGRKADWILLLAWPVYVVTIILAPHPMISSQYTAPLIPFAVIAAAYVITRIHSHVARLGAVTLTLLLATNVLQALPYVLVQSSGLSPQAVEGVIVNPRAQFNAATPLAHYLTEQLSLRSPLFEYIYFVTHSYEHRLKAVIQFLNKNGNTRQVVLAPWHDADAIRFSTGMRVVYHFKPSFTIERVKALVYRPGVTPDWIIPNAYYEPEQPFFRFNREDYERIYIRAPKDYIYENEPNLDFFMWRTNTAAPDGFYIFKRRDQEGSL